MQDPDGQLRRWERVQSRRKRRAKEGRDALASRTLHPRGGEASGEDRPGIKERANGAEAVIGVARRVERRLSAA